MTTVLRFALLLFLVCSGQVYAEGITIEQGDAFLIELKGIRQELKEIKKRGLAAPAKGRNARPTTANVATLGNPILGDLKAPVTMVVLTD